MSYELRKEEKVDDLGEVGYVVAPFNESMALFKQEGLKLITARDLAYARIQTGENSSISQNGSWIKEGVLYFPKEKNKIVLVRSSLVLRSQTRATEAHRIEREFFITEKAANEYMERVRAQKDSVHVLTCIGSIPTDRFGEDETTAWLFRDQAQEYGRFLEEKAGINAMPLYFDGLEHIKSNGKAYANQLWFGRLGSDSILDCGGRGLSGSSRARGVKQPAEEKNIQANIYVPNPREVKQYLQIVEAVKKGTKPAQDLEKIVDFLNKFRKK